MHALLPQKASAGFDGTGKPLNILSVMDLRQYMRSWLFKNVKKKKTTTTKEVFNAQNFSKRPPVEMIHQQVTKLNIL